MIIRIKTGKKRQIIDITGKIEEVLQDSGSVNVFVKHTTAAITTADLDPGTDQDYLDALAKMTPDNNWQHPHEPGHFPDHLWSTIIGPEITIPYLDGKLSLGTWQRVILIELDGPRQREVAIKTI